MRTALVQSSIRTVTAPRPKARLLPLVVCAPLLATACGSTIPASSHVYGGGAAADALTVDGGATAGSRGATPPAAAEPTRMAAEAPGTTGRPRVPGTDQVNPRGVTAGGPAAPGVTATQVFVGFHIPRNAGAANAALGASGVTNGDEKREIAVLIADVNRRGGIAGRKLVPVFYEYDANDTRSTEAIGEEGCAALTRDNKVFAALGFITQNELSCLERAGVWVLTQQLKAAADRDTYREHPFYVELGSPNLDRAFTEWVPALSRQGWFAPWDAGAGRAAAAGRAKVGVVTLEYPSFRRSVTRSLVPGLRRAGYAPEVVYLPFPSSNAELGAFSSAIASAVLRFRWAGVEHVLITDSGGVVSLLFMNQAESQHYRPRYGGDTNNGWQALLDAGATSAAHLNGAMGVGFLPSLDLTPADNPDDGPYSNPERRRCLELYAKNEIRFSDTNAKGIGLLTCTRIWALETVLDRVRGPLTRGAALAAVESLGAGLRTTDTLGQLFGPGRHDGMSGYYDWQFVPTAGRFRYAGPLRRF